MKHNRPGIFLLALCLLLAIAAGAAVFAQSSAGLNLEWHIVANGGGESSSAGYRVEGTIGQSLAGPPPAAGASYVVSSGYWVFDARRAVYLPAVTRR